MAKGLIMGQPKARAAMIKIMRRGKADTEWEEAEKKRLAEEKRKKTRAAQRHARGRGKTILTSGGGLKTTLTRRKRLLGE